MKPVVRAAFFLLAGISAAHAAALKVGEAVFAKLETEHPYTASAPGAPAVVWSRTLQYFDAAYIAPHFARFHLAAGDFVIVRSPDGKQEWRYEGLGAAELGETEGGFWSSQIDGDTAIVELWSAGGKPAFGVTMDRYARGFPESEYVAGGNVIESVCGTDDSLQARCYQSSEPTIYNRSRAVARLLINGTDYCTGFLVGSQGHLLTNNHCITSASDAASTTYEFMAESPFCAASCQSPGSCPGTKFQTGSGALVQTDVELDYSLVLIAVNPSNTFGYLKLRREDPTVDERIYIPGYPSGLGKRIAVASTDSTDASGFCEIYRLDATPCVTGSAFNDIGYYCDTNGGSSGSPVIGYFDHKVVALHHCGTCTNRGLHITDVINRLGAALPASATFDPVGLVTLDKNRYGCSTTMTITLRDDNLAAASSQAVTVTSTTQSDPETVLLAASPPGSGKFVGTVMTSPMVPSPDGSVSVAPGDTITVTYVDADDGSGGVNVPRTATALADCTGPVLTAVQASNVKGSTADVSFTSDEPCNGAVVYGPAGSPPPTQTVSAPGLLTAHTIHLSGLIPCNDYLFRVACTDSSGNTGGNDNQGSYFVFTTGTNMMPTYAATGLPLNIPDNDPAGVLATITVYDPNIMLDLNVKVSITHSYDTDLVLSLTGPDDTTVLLSNRRPNDGGGTNFTNTVFDDQASTPISSVSWAQSPYTGSFVPEQPLSVFNGKVAAGTWTLKVVDAASVDVGTLDDFQLSFTYEAQPCGPAVVRYSQALVSDSCSGGGGGSGNSVWDDGEDAQFSVTLRNSGTVTLTGVSATLVPTTQGVTMTLGSANYPNMPFGATAVSQAPHFGARLPAGLPCGTSVNFDATITTDQGTFYDTVTLVSGQVISGSGTALDVHFSNGIPLTWSIVNGGTGPGASVTWTSVNPGNRTFVSPIIAPVAIMDSDYAGQGSTSDDSLLTPVMDFSNATTVTLSFDQFFRYYSSASLEKGDVDVHSSLTGGNWVNVLRNELASSPNPDHRVLDISDQAAGASDVQIRFHYWNAAWEFWWEIDNVKVTYVGPDACNQTSCGAVQLPDEVFQVRWTNRTVMTWAPLFTATSYNVYRGAGVDMPKLLNVNSDSCLRTSVASSSASGLTENPAVGTTLWWLVRGVNQVGEGPPGFATAGPRTQDSVGACP